MTVWLERLKPSDLHIILPQVLLTLDQIRDQAMGPERRLAMLRALKDQVEAIQAALPESGSPVQGWSPPASQYPLTLEQRLARSWCSNLQRLLMEFGQPRYQGHARFAVYREWTLRQLLRGLTQAVEHTIGTRQPAPAGLWRSIYDAFLYLEGRDELQGFPVADRCQFDPGKELKRLFLLGGIAAFAEGSVTIKEIGVRLRDWAEAAALSRGESLSGESRFLRVDVSCDEPPSWGSPAVRGAYSGWVLEVPAAVGDYLESIVPGARRQPEDV
ncbi:MAG: hypothetical protein WAK53_07390 [Chromatiaceae bacterium]